MISFTQGATLFKTLSQNSTAANATLYGQLSNIEHRYALQKYYANETSYQISTIGGNTYYITAAPNVGDISATLAVAWGSPTLNIIVTFSDGETRNVLFTNGSTAITWQVPLAGTSFTLTANVASGATSATLASTWSTATQTSTTQFTDGETKSVTFTKNSTAISWTGGLISTVGSTVQTSVMTTAISIGGAQFYRMPPNYSKLKTLTITVGNLQWTLNEIRTREEWDRINTFPYFASIPDSYYIFPGGDHSGKIGIWPIPSSTSNIITFNYKFRVPDLSIPDYVSTTASVQGTVSVSNGDTVVRGSGTSFVVTTDQANESRWIQFSNVKADGTSAQGNNLWMQIYSVDSATQITLYQPYQGNTITTSSDYTIGQMPLIAEDFQDILVWKSLVHFFTSIVDNPKKREEFEDTYKEKIALLSAYSGSNTLQVNLSPKRHGRNPNLYPYGNLG